MNRYLFLKKTKIDTTHGEYTIHNPFAIFPHDMSKDEDVYVYNVDILMKSLRDPEFTGNIVKMLPDGDNISSITTIQKYWYYAFRGVLINMNQFSVGR